MNIRERYKRFKIWQHHAFDWRVLLMLAVSFMFTMLAISVTEVVTMPAVTFAQKYKTIALQLTLAVVPMLAAMWFSKWQAKRRAS